MKTRIRDGVYPTMITPYGPHGEIDWPAVREIVEFYIDHGCDGVFAVCQSSEMFALSLKERVRLAGEVVAAANGRLSVVASGNVSRGLEAQAEEVRAMAGAGVDAVVLVSTVLPTRMRGTAFGRTMWGACWRRPPPRCPGDV